MIAPAFRAGKSYAPTAIGGTRCFASMERIRNETAGSARWGKQMHAAVFDTPRDDDLSMASPLVGMNL
ncbi:hypothetical protein WI37_27925 [Burkholderia ubonensis]|nr:hypothetical protein WI37_27925 [Burkholderia ubonensis]